MPVSIGSLINKAENQKVRTIVAVGGDVVKVFEPTMQQLKEIVEIQERWVSKDLSDTEVSISGEDLIRILFPMLTDLENLSELSDEEVNEIVDNPSMLFLQVQYELEAIISEIYSTLLAANKRNVSHLDLEFGLKKQEIDLVDRMIANAPADLRVKIEQLIEQVEEAESQETDNIDNKGESNEPIDIAEYLPKKEDKKDEYAEKLNRYLDRFNESDLEDEE